MTFTDKIMLQNSSHFLLHFSYSNPFTYSKVFYLILDCYNRTQLSKYGNNTVTSLLFT